MSADDLDEKLRRRFAALRAEDRQIAPPLRLDPAATARQKARRKDHTPRPALAAAAALFAVVSIGAVFLTTQPRQPPDTTLLAMQTMPTTDWLLDTPRREDLLQLQTQIEKELIDENRN